MITQSRLKEVLRYEPETGLFYWAVKKGPAKAGDVAGTPHHLGYVCIRVDGIKHQAHRLAFLYMAGRWPDADIDHINHARSDNRWRNLREATRAENAKNASRYSTNSSGHHGVSWRAREKSWIARICVNGTHIHLGTYPDAASAIAARKKAESKYGFHPNHGSNNHWKE